jgi:hypothetical protein
MSNKNSGNRNKGNQIGRSQKCAELGKYIVTKVTAAWSIVGGGSPIRKAIFMFFIGFLGLLLLWGVGRWIQSSIESFLTVVGALLFGITPKVISGGNRDIGGASSEGSSNKEKLTLIDKQSELAEQQMAQAQQDSLEVKNEAMAKRGEEVDSWLDR